MAGRHDDTGQRNPKDTFITVYGRMPVLEVLSDRALRVDKLVVADSARGGNLDRILDLAARQGVPVRTAPAQRVKLLAGNGKHDQGIIADVVAPRMRGLAEFVRSIRSGGRHDVLILDGVNNPANVGMIIRTATAAGVSAVVLPRAGSPDIDPLVIKASAGVAFRASIVRCRTAAEAVRELSRIGFRVHGLSGDGRSTLYRERFPGLSAFVLGNETEGLSRETAELVDRWISIPMAGGVESLNVASAAAVLCFDLVRRAEERADAPADRPRPTRQTRPPARRRR
ncbi:TrmH family RNA methyltransferase [Actinocatenispora rupis]|uniref:RNA methyltransferase n=1 Tax=Actinocatenispora rupis TaxID=519421 RepID=A0A8J3J453_9ACTN|nr:RNA methyltransferase [Actinocatenispora rupis]GID09807.1 RNA methyltransferase [Actinocatenispora rupis]